MAETTTTAAARASGVPSAQGINRLAFTSAQQGNQAAVNLALLEAENTQAAGASPGTPSTGAQGMNPSHERLMRHKWAGYTGQVNHAQAAQPGSDVWVTVPVDKILVAPGGGHAIAPVYATTEGYKARPGTSAGSVPPPATSAARKP